MEDRDRALSALFALDPGCNREGWVRIMMAAKSAGLTLEDITEWSTPAHNFGGDRDCAHVWRSIQDGPVKAATLFHMAREAGWVDATREHQTSFEGRGTRVRRNGREPHSAADGDRRATVAEFWEQCIPATGANPYVMAKNGNPDGLRVVPDNDARTIAGQSVAGWLVVPAFSLTGELRTLQLIPPPGAGKKLNFPGASFADALFMIGDATHATRIYVCEGIGQAWACRHATECSAAAVSFGAGRMATVAKALCREYPQHSLVLVPDRGKEVDAQSIAKEVRGSYVELPTDKPVNYDANDLAAEDGLDVLARLLEHPKLPAMRYRLLGSADLANIQPLNWLIRGVLPSRGLACIFGASGSGKSFLALDLCAAIALGVDWFDRRVARAPVVYAALEGEAGFAQRIKAWQMRHGDDLPPTLHFVMQPFDLRKPEDVADLAEAVAVSGSAGGLLVIDTLNRAASGADENSSSDMGVIIEAAKVLQSRVGGLVLLIHHSGKDQSKGMRGHSSLHAALDAAIEVVRADDRRSWRTAKSKDGSDSTAYFFRLESLDVGEHDDGEPITSCVIVPDDSRVTFRRVMPPKGGNQKVAWDALADMFRSSSTTHPLEAPAAVPSGRPCMQVEAAIDGIRHRLVCDPKRRTERAQQALTGLHAKGLIVIDRGYLWMT